MLRPSVFGGSCRLDVGVLGLVGGSCPLVVSARRAAAGSGHGYAVLQVSRLCGLHGHKIILALRGTVDCICIPSLVVFLKVVDPFGRICSHHTLA